LSIVGLQFDDCPNLPKDTPYQRCSPWPHFGGTYNTNSRYSTIIGSQRGNIENLFNTENKDVTISSSSVAADGTFYNCFNIMKLIDDNFTAIQGYIKAFNSEGKEKWIFVLEDNDTFIRSSPTIGPNNIIYFGTALGYIYALNPDGTLNWKKQYLENIIEINGLIPLSIYGSLTIGKDGNIYFGGTASYTTSNINYGIAVLLSVNKYDVSTLLSAQFQPPHKFGES
jgi:outer membrane protein assembly factor BamB